MIINSVLSVETSFTPNFFGGDVTRFNTVQRATVRGAVVDVSNVAGVSTTVASYLTDLMGTGGYEEVFVGSERLGLFRLVDFSFPAGDLVNYSEATLVFEGQSVGDVSPISDDPYYECFVNSAVFAYASEIGESWSYSRSNNSFSINHTLTLTLLAQVNQAQGMVISPLSRLRDLSGTPALSAGVANPAQLSVGTVAQASARTFAHKIFRCTDADPWFTMGLDGGPGGSTISDFPDPGSTWKKRFSQTEDKMQNTVSYTETFESSNPDADDGVAYQRSSTFARDTNNVVSVKEEGEVEDLGSLGSPSWLLGGGAGAVVDDLLKPEGDAVTRLQAFFTDLKSDVDEPLAVENGYPKVVFTSKGINNLTSTVSYSLVLSNDPTLTGGTGFTYSRTTSTNKEGCWISKNYTMNYKGNGPTYQSGIYVAWKQAVSGASGHWRRRPTLAGFSPRPISSSRSDQKAQGTVTLGYNYSQDPIYARNDEGFKVYSENVSRNPSYDSKIYFPALNLYTADDNKKDIIAQDGATINELFTVDLSIMGDGFTYSVVGGTAEDPKDTFWPAVLGEAKTALNTYSCSFWRNLEYSYTVEPGQNINIRAEAVVT